MPTHRTNKTLTHHNKERWLAATFEQHVFDILSRGHTGGSGGPFGLGRITLFASCNQQLAACPLHGCLTPTAPQPQPLLLAQSQPRAPGARVVAAATGNTCGLHRSRPQAAAPAQPLQGWWMMSLKLRMPGPHQMKGTRASTTSQLRHNYTQ